MRRSLLGGAAGTVSTCRLTVYSCRFPLLHKFPETRWTVCLFLSYPSVMALSRASAFQGSVANSGPGGLCCKDFALVADHLREDEITSQATAWTSQAMN